MRKKRSFAGGVPNKSRQPEAEIGDRAEIEPTRRWQSGAPVSA
jgi:hypothetical protein